MALLFDLQCQRSARVPQLAWCAVVEQRLERVIVSHGRSVEVRGQFFIEGTWNGDFADGDFVSTECVFGSGAVLTRDGITFVSSCSTTDSLFYSRGDDGVVVSNSLAFLLAATDDELDFGYTGYFVDCESILKGINDYRSVLPTRNGSVRRLLFRNLSVTRDAVEHVEKRMAPRFHAYEDYRDYIDGNYRRIAANIRSASRAEPVDIVSTQSRGYDTTAVNALASQYGIDRVFTSTFSKSVVPFGEQRNRGFLNDDGSEICHTLGLTCVRIDRRHYRKSGFPDEYLYYAGQAGVQDANLLEINSKLTRVSVLLTGLFGELWYDATGYARTPGYLTTELRRSDVGGHGLAEVRLRVGFVQVAVPFMGGQRRADVFRITDSADMDPWRVNPRYDRPIARRIAEERGVPRELFGQTKMGSVVLFPKPFLPYNTELRREFMDTLIDRGVISRGQATVWPVVQVINKVIDWRSQHRFRAVYYMERAVATLTSRSFEFGRVWSHLNGSLFCHCVNKCAREYAGWMGADTADHRLGALTASAPIGVRRLYAGR